MSRRTLLLIAAGSALLLIPTLALTQDVSPGRGGRGQGRERTLNNIKEQMGVSEDQWNALAPKVQKILELQRDLRPAMGRSGGPGGAGGPGGGDANQSMTPVALAQRDLRTALESKDTPAADIAKKLTAYRAARDKARTDLQAAQKDLKGQVKDRQEAVLVVFGLLD